MIYAKKDKLLPADYDYLFPTLTQHLTKSTTDFENWLNAFCDLFQRSIGCVKRSAAQGTLSIQDYFACQQQVAVDHDSDLACLSLY